MPLHRSTRAVKTRSSPARSARRRASSSRSTGPGPDDFEELPLTNYALVFDRPTRNPV